MPELEALYIRSLRPARFDFAKRDRKAVKARRSGRDRRKRAEHPVFADYDTWPARSTNLYGNFQPSPRVKYTWWDSYPALQYQITCFV